VGRQQSVAHRRPVHALSPARLSHHTSIISHRRPGRPWDHRPGWRGPGPCSAIPSGSPWWPRRQPAQHHLRPNNTGRTGPSGPRKAYVRCSASGRVQRSPTTSRRGWPAAATVARSSGGNSTAKKSRCTASAGCSTRGSVDLALSVTAERLRVRQSGPYQSDSHAHAPHQADQTAIAWMIHAEAPQERLGWTVTKGHRTNQKGPAYPR